MPPSQDQHGPRPQADRGPRVTRRQAIAGAALVGASVGVGAGVDRAIESGSPTGTVSASADNRSPAVRFHGERQAGIATPMQAHLNFAAFDVARASGRETARDAAERLAGLLRRWSAAAAALSLGRPYPVADGDPGEALGLPPSRLTLTFGLGPSLFGERFGLADRKPSALEQLPPFAGETLDPAQSNGDLCVQACADDPQVAFHAVHVLARVAGSDASVRWAQLGFRPGAGTVPDAETRRNLLGFKDGTENIALDDHAALNQFVWVQSGDGPAWMTGGSYLIARRVEIVFSSWDGVSRAAQERVIGRKKLDGAPLGGHHEHDPPNFGAKGPDGRPLIPLDAHIRVARPENNGGQRILRRGYSYSQGTSSSGGTDSPTGLDGGLFFIAFARSPARQFIPIQRRLSTGDALGAFTVPTASAIFACPPGARPGGFVGDRLFA